MSQDLSQKTIEEITLEVHHKRSQLKKLVEFLNNLVEEKSGVVKEKKPKRKASSDKPVKVGKAIEPKPLKPDKPNKK